MAITAQSIIQRVVVTLQDTTSVRWPANELVRYLNDGQREVAMLRPDATVTNATKVLSPGAKQALPSNGAKLLDVVRNTGGNQRAVRMTSRTVLDSQIPSWQNQTGATEILHYTYDPRDPKVFYVYPPAAAANASVEIVYSAYPTNITEPADGALYTAISGDISLPDIYANPLADYVLYRAYTKDTEFASNVQRAQAHYGAFTGALNAELSGTAGVTPKA